MSDWVIRLIEQSGYLGVAFLMFLETIFPPIPSEVIMPIAGMAAAKGKLGFIPVVASGTAGAMLGNTVWYLAARALGVHRLKPLITRYGRWLTISWPEVERAESWFAQHGTFFVFFGRLLPTVARWSRSRRSAAVRSEFFSLAMGTASDDDPRRAGYRCRQRHEASGWSAPCPTGCWCALLAMRGGYGFTQQGKREEKPDLD